MNVVTVGFKHIATAEELAAVEASLRAWGGTVKWRTNTRGGRTYGVASVPSASEAASVGASTRATVYETAIIALALFPEVPEALPHLLAALGGDGRPAGVLACEPCAGGAIVEWDPRRTTAATVLEVADVELRRFNSGRTAELLAPLPPDVVTAVAAEGLQAPEIAPDRELETLLERAGVLRA